VPPRYAYWTIIVDNRPTAFRSASVDELVPTFNRLQSKHPDAVLKWFQNGKLWDSQRQAREAQERRGERGRKFDANQRRDAGDARTPEGKLQWKPKGSLDWKAKGPADDRGRPKPEWKPKRKPFRRDDRRSDAGGRDKQWERKRDRPGVDKRDRPKLEWSPRPHGN
jgi:hypothetical protein